jgi:hypothetical protein
MGEARHSFAGPPRTHGQARMEVEQQTTTTPQAHPLEPQWDTGYGGGYSCDHEGGSYYPSHGYPEPSLWARTSASARYAPLEWYFSYGVGQAEHVVEGIDNSSDGWMTLQTCKRRCKPPSTRRQIWCTTSSVTSGLTLMLKSCKDLSLGEVPDAQVWVRTCLILFLTFSVISSLVLPVSLLSSWLLVSIASLS